MAEAENDLVGLRIATYHITKNIGQGGNATVYLAQDEKLNRVVALKMMHAFTHHPHRQRFIERFRRGAEASARLNHPNILPVYDFGEWQGCFYIVMQYVQGQTLHQRLLNDAPDLKADNPLSLLETLHIAQEVGAALSYAHQHGVVHRDVKPSNILIGEDGRIYLADFGLAHVQDAAPITQSGEMLGTPHYMSPEQIQGFPIDARSDIYSLGVVLFHLLTGQVPFEAETPFPVILKHVQEPLPSPRKINPDVPLMVEAILRKALAKEPTERYQTVREFIQDLELAVREATTGDEGIVPPVPPPPIRPPSPAVPAASPDERDGVRWVLVGVALLGLVAVALCGVIAFLLLGGPDLLKNPTATPTRMVAVAMTPTPTFTAAPPTSTPLPTHTSPAAAAPTFTAPPPTETLAKPTPTPTPTETTETPSATPTARPTDTPTSAPPPSTSTPTTTASPTPTFTATLTAAPIPTKPSAVPANMILIPAGEFIQGSSDAEIDAALKMCNDAYGGNCPHTRNWFTDEAPRRIVYLNAFYIDRQEVTNGQFAAFTAATGYQTDAEKRGESQTWRTFNTAGRENYPVVWMSWNDADAYCRWAGKRLPTEAEWEKAARGSKGLIWPWGSTWKSGLANTGDGGAGSVVAVGSYPASASPYDVMDMTGNVWEWVADWYDPLWYGKSPTNNPGGPLTGVGRVLRGGGFNNPPWEVRAPHRHSGGPDGYAPDHGFRCAQ